METTIMALYRGLYRDNGKENGYYHTGVILGYDIWGVISG